MKNILWGFVVCATLSSDVFVQQVPTNNVPVPVRQAYQARFPGVRAVEWKWKKDHNYEAEFTLHRIEIAAKFDSTGRWLETESAIPKSRLPRKVQATISQKFRNYEVIETQSIQRFDQKHLLYEVHVAKGISILKLQLDGSGALLSKSATIK